MPVDELDCFVDELALRIAGLLPGVISAETAVDASEGPIIEALRVLNKQLIALGSAPAAVELNETALIADAQTRIGTLNRDEILRKLQN